MLASRHSGRCRGGHQEGYAWRPSDDDDDETVGFRGRRIRYLQVKIVINSRL